MQAHLRKRLRKRHGKDRIRLGKPRSVGKFRPVINHGDGKIQQFGDLAQWLADMPRPTNHQLGLDAETLNKACASLPVFEQHSPLLGARLCQKRIERRICLPVSYTHLL